MPWWKRPKPTPPSPPVEQPRKFTYESPEELCAQIEAYWDTQDDIEPLKPNKPNTIDLEARLSLSMRERNRFQHSHFEGRALDYAYHDYQQFIREEWIEVCSKIRDKKRAELSIKKELMRQQFILQRDEQRRLEREQLQAQRKAEWELEKQRRELQRQQEQELRDPTPTMQSSDYPTDIPYHSLLPPNAISPEIINPSKRGKRERSRRRSNCNSFRIISFGS